MANLFALLSRESGKVERMRAASAAARMDQECAPARLARRDGCTPGPTAADLLAAMHAAALLTQEVSAAISARHDWPWPSRLAEQIIPLFSID